METRGLANITNSLEERDQRSKWDWAALGAAMLFAAGLAGTGAIYFTKQNLDTTRFDETLRFIVDDGNAYWCNRTDAAIINDRNGKWYCAIPMPKYQEPEEGGPYSRRAYTKPSKRSISDIFLSEKQHSSVAL
jgi:hypothetical protein